MPEGVTEVALPDGWCIVAHEVLSRGSLALLTATPVSGGGMVGNDSAHIFNVDFGFGHFSPFSRLRPSLDLYYTLLEILNETGEKSVLQQPQ